MATVKEIMESAKDRMSKSVDVYRREMVSLRAGRANPQILDRITVDYYGTPTPIPQVGGVSSPEPRMLIISPWDASLLKPIVKALQKSDLGINPVDDGKVIRLVFPAPTEERRKELAKQASKGAEDAKVAVRAIRRDAIEQFKKLRKASEITEDDERKASEDMQKQTDAAIREVDEVCEAKKKEIMEV